jgi:sulfatase modifying factor 1
MLLVARTLLVLQGMVVIPSGTYTPLYQTAGGARVHVARFALDRSPVTRGDYLRFVTSHPSWRRSAIESSLAEGGYLDTWRGDLDAGNANDLRRPVTGVSWFAANAYCAALGKRLPTVDEWEYAGAASETEGDAAWKPAFIQRLLGLYASRVVDDLPPVERGFKNVYGVSDLHGGAWEWTADFDGNLPSSHSHHASHKHDSSCAGAAIGAPDPTNYPAFMRFAFRSALTRRTTVRSLGFRCAAGAPA